ncbi:MAG: aminotransferase class I/II-fold pyridoxal phosphate-dependent enzyme [Saprospiraceae bacterium]|nr:MAG: aminotransferase class I/II-fold pyridoxal phosphate-dependent enzyme [Saprospiraceae bacterium]
MTDILAQAYDPEHFRWQGHQLVDHLADYLAGMYSGSDSLEKVLHYASPEELYQRWKDDLAQAPNPDLPAYFEAILHDTIHMHHPKYMGHQTSNVAPTAALAGLAGELLDPGMGVYEQGTAGVVFERLITEALGREMGWGEATEGFLTSGGTLGNLTAMLCARQVMIERDVWENGFEGRQCAFLASSEAHYSIGRAAKVMGMGSRGVVPVPVNERFQMDISRLEECYQRAENQGVKIIGVVASSCATATGSYDPLDEIAGFCEAKKLWLHVDGAHGACVIFSKKLKYLLKGIERADSVILDFHKMLMVPKLVTAVAFRRPGHSYQTFAQKASYLWDKDEGHEWYNLAKRTFELTKSFMSVRVYALWRTYGTQLFAENVETLYDLARTFARLIASSGDFEMPVAVPESNIVCFRFFQIGWSEKKTERVNAEIREKLVMDGEYFIVQTRVQGKLYLRTTLMNPFTTERELAGLLEKIRNVIGYSELGMGNE